MNKIQKALKAFRLIAARPSLLNLVLDHEENYRKQVLGKFNLPKGLQRIAFEHFRKNVDTVEPFTFLEGGSLPTDYLLLAAIARELNEPVCFEIGTWRGESALNMARFARHVYTLNLSPSMLKESGFSGAYAEMQGSMCRGNEKITQLWGDSMNFDFSGYQGRCDLVFVDGDHHCASVIKDTQTAFSLLRDEKSVIVWHDYGNGTETTRWEVLLGILEATPAEKRKHLYAVSNTLCAVYYPYSVQSAFADFPQAPSEVYKVTVEPVQKEPR